MEQDNTQPEFFYHWSHDQLVNECARLNVVLRECAMSAEKASEVLDTIGDYDKQKDLEQMGN